MLIIITLILHLLVFRLRLQWGLELSRPGWNLNWASVIQIWMMELLMIPSINLLMCQWLLGLDLTLKVGLGNFPHCWICCQYYSSLARDMISSTCKIVDFHWIEIWAILENTSSNSWPGWRQSSKTHLSTMTCSLSCCKEWIEPLRIDFWGYVNFEKISKVAHQQSNSS